MSSTFDGDVFVSPWPWPVNEKGEPLDLVAGATLMLQRAQRELTKRAIRSAQGDSERHQARRALVELLEMPFDDEPREAIPPSPREAQRKHKPASQEAHVGKAKTPVKWVQPANLLAQTGGEA
jgi:hypothetical protein